MINNQLIKTNKHSFRILIIVVFIILVGLVVILINQTVKTKPEMFGGLTTKISQAPTLVPHPTKGQLLIKVEDSQAKHPITDYLIFEITAGSEGADIAGYDIILDYDDQAFELVQADSVLPGFQLFKLDSDGMLILTGAKKINDQSSHIWAGESILKLTFKPIKTGRYQFRILSGSGKEKTQFVDTQTQITYPTASDTSVEIY